MPCTENNTLILAQSCFEVKDRFVCLYLKLFCIIIIFVLKIPLMSPEFTQPSKSPLETMLTVRPFQVVEFLDGVSSIRNV